MATLYELSNFAIELENILDQVDSDSIEEFLIAQEETAESLEQKMIDYGYVILEKESETESIKSEIERLKGRIIKNKRNIDSMKKSLLSAFEIVKKTKIKDDLITLSKRRLPKRLNIVDEDKISDRFKNTEIKFNPGEIDFMDLVELKEKYEKMEVNQKISKSVIDKYFKETGEVINGTEVIDGYSVSVK